MKKSRWTLIARSKGESAFTLLECIVALGLVGFLFAAVMQVLSTYTTGMKLSIERGDKEYLRTFFRRSVDCTKTFANQGAACNLALPIDIYRKDGSRIIAERTYDEMRLGKYSMRVLCQKDAIAFALQPQFKKTGDAVYADLFDVPPTCPIANPCASQVGLRPPQLAHNSTEVDIISPTNTDIPDNFLCIAWKPHATAIAYEVVMYDQVRMSSGPVFYADNFVGTEIRTSTPLIRSTYSLHVRPIFPLPLSRGGWNYIVVNAGPPY